MLKINLTGEWLAREFYDTALVGSNVIVALAPTAIAVVLGLHRLASEWADSASDPLAKGDRARILDCPKSLRSCGHIATVLSSTDDTITVRVRILASSPWKGLCLARCRRYFCCCPGTAVETFEHELAREQLQLILGRKQFLRLCVGVCKQLLLCWRARGALDSPADAKEDSGEDSKEQNDATTDDTGAMARDITGVEDIEADDDLDDINLKEEALHALRSVCEPALARRGVTWEHAKGVIAKVSSLSELQQAIEDPEAFVARIVELVAPVMRSALLDKLRPQLEPVLLDHGVTWEQAEPLLSQLTSIDRLQAAVDNPQSFVRELLSASGPAAKALAIAKLRPVLAPLLIERGILGDATQTVAGKVSGTVDGVTASVQLPQWDSFVPVLSFIDTVDELQAAIENPQRLVDNLLSVASAASKAFAIARLQPVIEQAVLDAIGLSWEQITPVLELIDSLDELQAAIACPGAFVEALLSATSPYALQVALVRLEANMRPLVEAENVRWADALTVLEHFGLEELRVGVLEPQALLALVIDLVGSGSGATKILP
jgi:hypothetical protein